MSALAAIAGAVVGLGVVVLLAGSHGWEHSSRQQARRPWSGRIEDLSRRAMLGALCAAIVGLLTRWPVGALLAGAFGFGASRLFGGAAARKASIARTEAVAAWAEMLRDTMAGAAGIEQAIVATAPVSPPPIRPEVTGLARRLERDRLGPALREFADELADPTADLVVAALMLAAGNRARRLGELLGALATSARAQATLQLRVDAGRARMRTASRVITVFTLGFALGLVVLNRGYLHPYDGTTGQVVLLVVGLCFGVAFWWLAAMARIEAPERFLAGHATGESAP